MVETFEEVLLGFLVSHFAGALPHGHGRVPVTVLERTQTVLIVQAGGHTYVRQRRSGGILDKDEDHEANQTFLFIFTIITIIFRRVLV